MRWRAIAVAGAASLGLVGCKEQDPDIGQTRGQATAQKYPPQATQGEPQGIAPAQIAGAARPVHPGANPDPRPRRQRGTGARGPEHPGGAQRAAGAVRRHPARLRRPRFAGCLERRGHAGRGDASLERERRRGHRGQVDPAGLGRRVVRAAAPARERRSAAGRGLADAGPRPARRRSPEETLSLPLALLGERLGAGDDARDVGIHFAGLARRALQLLALAPLALLILEASALLALLLSLPLRRASLLLHRSSRERERGKRGPAIPREAPGPLSENLDAPRWPETFLGLQALRALFTSNSTFCPSERVRKPSALIAVWWRNTSWDRHCPA